MTGLAPIVEAVAPPEDEGLRRDEVALLVARRADGAIAHARFRDLPRFLRAGDVVVVNRSATLPAAVPGRMGARAVELRLSTPAEAGAWVVELRTEERAPLRRPPSGARVDLPGGARAELTAPYLGSDRLHVAQLSLPEPLHDYLRRHGHAIRYGYVDRDWPIDRYQTVFATEPGSAEMPSAGRPFTTELVTRLAAAGVLIAPLVLHTGVSSLEGGEAPYREPYAVPGPTARLVSAARGWDGRVIAVGTTVVRALESVASRDGSVRPGAGWTDLVVTPERGLWAIDGLVTGWHEATSSHVRLIEAAAGRALLECSYATARIRGYRFHEFGDSHLILP